MHLITTTTVILAPLLPLAMATPIAPSRLVARQDQTKRQAASCHAMLVHSRTSDYQWATLGTVSDAKGVVHNASSSQDLVNMPLRGSRDNAITIPVDGLAKEIWIWVEGSQGVTLAYDTEWINSETSAGGAAVPGSAAEPWGPVSDADGNPGRAEEARQIAYAFDC